MSSVVEMGASYEVRNVQDFFAGPVTSGTYQGGTISLPMSGLSVAQPVGAPSGIDPSETPGKEFNVFVLVSECSPG